MSMFNALKISVIYACATVLIIHGHEVAGVWMIVIATCLFDI
jgi:hypothetical protein